MVHRYSARQVATALGLNVETVRRAIRNRHLEAVPTGRRGHYWHVYETAVVTWISGKDGQTVLARALSRKPRASNAPSQPTPDADAGNRPESHQGKARPRKTKP